MADDSPNLSEHIFVEYPAAIPRVERICFIRIIESMISDMSAAGEEDARLGIQECDREPCP